MKTLFKILIVLWMLAISITQWNTTKKLQLHQTHLELDEELQTITLEILKQHIIDEETKTKMPQDRFSKPGFKPNDYYERAGNGHKEFGKASNID